MKFINTIDLIKLNKHKPMFLEQGVWVEVFSLEFIGAYSFGGDHRRSQTLQPVFYEPARNELPQTAYEAQLSCEKLRVIFTYRHSGLKHSAHILTHNFLLFSSRQLVHTHFLYTLVTITAYSCNLFTHTDLRVGYLSLTHNLQWHIVYGDIRWDFFEE